tara:strand:+ start:15256 stop:15507 length:252 start_codon:yes stop_codon:yes gene_type:complete
MTARETTMAAELSAAVINNQLIMLPSVGGACDVKTHRLYPMSANGDPVWEDFNYLEDAPEEWFNELSPEDAIALASNGLELYF